MFKCASNVKGTVLCVVVIVWVGREIWKEVWENLKVRLCCCCMINLYAGLGNVFGMVSEKCFI
jgi:hypothetical protein